MFLWHGWYPGHGPSNYEEWFNLNKQDEYYEVQYKYYYEPFYLSLNATTPMYDNRFIQVLTLVLACHLLLYYCFCTSLLF